MEQERINELKTQKTARNSSKQDVSLDPLRHPDGTARFNSKEDLENLSKDSDPKVAKAAAAALHQLSVTADKAKKKIDELDQEYVKLTQQLQEANEKYNDLSSSTRILTEEEKANYDTVSKFAQEQTKSIEQVTEASQKQGEEYVKTSKALDKQQTSLKGAVKQLFS
jgi:vacuolar-type H+-ATPase subunit I/STV1